MTKTEYIEELRSGLYGEVPARVVQESVDYYYRYINESIADGKTEEQVLEELGPVRLIVKSIIDANAGAGRREEMEYEYQQEQGNKEKQKEKKEKPRFHTDINDKGQLDLKFGKFSFNSWYGKLLLALLALLVLVIVIALVVVIIIVAWYLLPIIAIIALIVILLRIFLKRKK